MGLHPGEIAHHGGLDDDLLEAGPLGIRTNPPQHLVHVSTDRPAQRWHLNLTTGPSLHLHPILYQRIPTGIILLHDHLMRQLRLPQFRQS